ncbi:hypothetical protein ON010_g12198 [Phytophthora cinnamomi]|nr:hypothetical protein ON010_g12198 [Phytophthora cinnamomi]
MSQAISTQTPAKRAEVPYSNQNDAAAAQPAKDLESEDGLTRGQWQVGLWDCFTDLMPNCFMVTCCACVSMAQIAHRLGVATYSKALIVCLVVVLSEFVISGIASAAASSSTTVKASYSNDGTAVTYSTSNGSGAAVLVFRAIMILVRVVFALFVMHLRKTTRQRFQIPGNPRNDFIASLCCSCCVLAQMATHIKSYTPGSCDFGPVADTVSIPAMMVSRSHSTDIFQEIREAYLDRRELSFTIRFLGAQTASRVLAQQERLAQLDRNAARSIEMKQQREYQQQEATTLLRTRLGKAPQSKSSAPASVSESVLATPSTSASEFTFDWSPASSMRSSASPRHSRARDCHDEIRRADNQNELQLVEGVHAAAALAMLHWCPMTTALVILDVQNYFTMRHGYGADRTADCTGSGSDEEFDIKRGSESTHASSSKGRSSVEFYERVDNVLIPTIQDVLLASRATEGMEVIYSVVESATRDGRERSRAHKHAGIHVPKHGFGAQVPKRIAPDDGNDIVLSRTGVNVFAATNLDYVLRNLMVTHIVVMGISVLGSVESCVQTALDRGYQVSVLKEAVISLAGPTIGSSKTSSMLESLSKRGVQILSTDDFVDKLQSFA